MQADFLKWGAFLEENVGKFHVQPLDGSKATQIYSRARTLSTINEAINGFKWSVSSQH